MVEPQHPTDNLSPAPASEAAMAGLKPIMTLIAATLQSAHDQCACGACRLLQLHAEDLVPLILRMASPEVK